MTTHLPTDCSHCGGDELYVRRVPSGGGLGPYLLSGLGPFVLKFFESGPPKFDVVVCARCGLTRFFAEPQARQRLEGNEYWRPLRGARETPET